MVANPIDRYDVSNRSGPHNERRRIRSTLMFKFEKASGRNHDPFKVLRRCASTAALVAICCGFVGRPFRARKLGRRGMDLPKTRFLIWLRPSSPGSPWASIGSTRRRDWAAARSGRTPPTPFHGTRDGQVTPHIGNIKDPVLKPWAARQMQDSNDEVM
jgi:hypothetical protein